MHHDAYVVYIRTAALNGCETVVVAYGFTAFVRLM